MAEHDTAILLLRIAALETQNARLQQAQDDAAAFQARHSAALMADLQHRVRNMLATVRGIVSRTVAGASTVEQFVAHLQGRLDTLARLQGALTRTDRGGLDLEELVREEFVAQGGSTDDQVGVEGPSVTLRDQTAELVGLALHELAVNAVKFGALSTESGHVTVRWRIERVHEQPCMILEWNESAAPAPPDKDHRGFGRELIEHGLPYQLSARTSFEFQPGGILCSIALPLGTGEDQAGVSLTPDAAP